MIRKWALVQPLWLWGDIDPFWAVILNESEAPSHRGGHVYEVDVPGMGGLAFWGDEVHDTIEVDAFDPEYDDYDRSAAAFTWNVPAHQEAVDEAIKRIDRFR